MSYIAEHGFNHSTYRDQLAREKQVRVYFVPAFDQRHQRRVYFYLVASAMLDDRMQEAISKGIVPDFAVVAEKGFDEPTEEVKARVKKYYNFDHDAEIAKRAIPKDKGSIRSMMIARREQLGSEEQKQATASVAKALDSICAERPGAVIAGYVAVRGELDVAEALKQAISNGHKVCLPVIIPQSKQLLFRYYHQEDTLITGAYDIPCPADTAKVLTPDIVLVPLVACDKQNNRLGYGGGYYDVTLAALKARNPYCLAIGVAYDFQQLDLLPVEAHDVRLDRIVTV